MTRGAVLGACVVAAASAAVPAGAYFHANSSGSGSGSGPVATMPDGNQPSGSAASRDVTVTVTQNTFSGAHLGTYAGGGYALTRYGAGSSTPVAPGAACAGTLSGAGATVQCVESTVAYGSWQYTVTPILNTFTGAESAKSTAVDVPPPAPTGVSATAAAAAHVTVGWNTVAGTSGYNIYRRTTAGSYNYAAPLNGATPATGTSYDDATAVNATTYNYTVRAVVVLAGGAQLESASATESSAVTADSSPPPVPSVTAATSGGPLLGATSCGVTGGSRYINNAGKSSVGVSATISAPEAGETVVFSATTSGSTPVTATVAAGSTTVTTTLDLSSLLDGTVTLTAKTKDAAGNASSTTGTTNTVIKDVTGGALSGVTYNAVALFADKLSGTSECGATITAVETVGPNVGRTFPTSGTFTVGAGGTFTNFTVDAVTLGNYGYDVTATDQAANPGTVQSVSGFDLL